MKQCANHHFYNEEKYSECPYCNENGTIGVTRPLTEKSLSPFVSGTPSYIPPTMPIVQEIGKTSPFYETPQGIAPACGWLVCVRGKQQGTDFRIHSDRNVLGRSSSNDICIDFDDSISKHGHIIITYDRLSNQFWVQQGSSVNNVYINSALLLYPKELQSYDRIAIGNTELMFVSCCNENFQWEDQ